MHSTILKSTCGKLAALAAAICVATGALYADLPQVNGTDFYFKGAAQNTYRLSQITSGWQYKNAASGSTYASGTYPGSGKNVYLRGGTFMIEAGDALVYRDLVIGQGWGLYTTNNITGGTLTLANEFRVGHWSDGHGCVNMSGGEVTTKRLLLGVDSDSKNQPCKDAHFNLSGGTLKLTGGGVCILSLGEEANSVVAFNQTGGTLKVSESGSWAHVGTASGSTAVYTMKGGTLDIRMATNGGFVVGGYGNGTLNVSGTAVFATMALMLGESAGGSGTVNLGQGGTISINGNNGNGHYKGVSAKNGSGTFNFDGGTLLVESDGISIGAAVTTTISSNGGTIDTQGHTFAVNSGITGAGALTLTGAGGALVVSCSQAFTGDLTISNDTTLVVTDSTTFAGRIVLGGASSKIRVDTANSQENVITLSATGYSVPSGSILDYVELTDSSNYTATSSGNTITVTLNDPVATWTGTANDGSPSNAVNWCVMQGETVLDNTLPDGGTIVVMQGQNVNMQLPSGSTLACKSFEIRDCTFTADCDWSGLSVTPTITGTANLDGHILTLNHLSAAAGSTFSGGDGSAVEFNVSEAATHVTFGEGEYIDGIANLTLSGSAKILLLKDGAGGTLDATELDLGKMHYAEFVQTNGAVNLGNVWSAIGGKNSKAGHGVYRMTGGTLTAATDFTVGSQAVGEFIQTGGNVTLNWWFNLGRNGGRGTYTISGGAMTNTYNNTVYVGAEGGTGTINISGDASVNFYRLTMGGYNTKGNKGYINLSGNGSFVTRSWGTIGTSANGYGEVNQSGGLFSVGAEFTVGEDGTGVYNLTGGEFSSGGNLWVGRSAVATSKGTFTQGTGSVACNDLRIGEGAGSVGTYTQNDGMLLPRSWERIGLSGVGTHVQNGGTNYFARKVDNWLKMGENATGVGTYKLNDGLLDVYSGIVVGIAGTATLELNGGKVVTQTISSQGGASMVFANGGTIEATASGNILTNIQDVAFGAGGLTIDTPSGINAAVSDCGYQLRDGSVLVKTGAGTLTFDVVPPVDVFVVSNGTVAISAGTDNASSVASLKHRWSFTSDYSDSVGGRTGTAIGSALAIESGEVVMSGNGNSTGSLNLGKGVMPSGDATIEIWAKRTGNKNWSRIFDFGTSTTDYFIMTWVSGTDGAKDVVELNKNNSKTTSNDTMKYDSNVKYHISVTFKANNNGSTTVSWTRRNVDTGVVEKSSSKTYSAWTLASIFAGDFYLGHSHFSQDLDANAKYDEVRIWNGALSADALTLSAQKGPDATAADIADIVAANDVPVTRTLELASGASLSIASGTLTQPVVKGCGTIAGGTLVVSDKIVATVGESIEASGTIDLSNAKIELVDPENLASPFTFLKPTTGQTLTVTGVPTPTNLPKQWKVSVSANGTGRIVKRGFMLIVK